MSFRASTALNLAEASLRARQADLDRRWAAHSLSRSTRLTEIALASTPVVRRSSYVVSSAYVPAVRHTSVRLSYRAPVSTTIITSRPRVHSTIIHTPVRRVSYVAPRVSYVAPRVSYVAPVVSYTPSVVRSSVYSYSTPLVSRVSVRPSYSSVRFY